jgi:hypothetical protein
MPKAVELAFLRVDVAEEVRSPEMKSLLLRDPV